MAAQRFGGLWTKEKLGILNAYLDRYTTALKNRPFTLTYVDAFAGSGSYAESSVEYVEFHEFRKGSTRIALDIKDRPFDRLIFIEKQVEAADALRELKSEYDRRKIEIVQQDANRFIPRFCKSMGDFDRAVVFLDPFATEVSWATVESIARTKKIDCWILFPLMAVSRMMPLDREPDKATAQQLDRIFGGRDHWSEIYEKDAQLSLLGEQPRRERRPGTEQIADRYRDRLYSAFEKVAPTRRFLRNSNNTPLFELVFAVGNPRGARIAIKIADHILKHL